MKMYNTIHQHDGITDYSRFTSLTAAKKWMRKRPGSTGYITKIYANGDWEPCGVITLKGSNAVQMSNQTTANY